MRQIIESIRHYFWRRRFARIIQRHVRNCPTGVAFYGALDFARLDNERWLKAQARAARRQS